MTILETRPSDSIAAELSSLVRPDEGMVSRTVFSDENVYRLELDRVFTKTWLYIAHESQLREPGDYVTNFMGEDPVIASRSATGDLYVLLNSCRHRGNAICATDAGTSKFFRCPYHGWTYGGNGDLVGVPKADMAYYGQLDKSRFGLLKVPRVERYQGMIFANWDPDAIPLADYLGDVRWYLDLPFKGALGGLEVAGPIMKYRIKTNWKLPAENFSGDDYHVLCTHGCAFQLGFLPDYDLLGDYIAYFDHGHGMGDITKPGRAMQNDLEMAQQLYGPEATEYVKQYHARLAKRLSALQANMYTIGQGNIFPQLSWIKFGCMHMFGLFQWHPKGPDEVEVWQTSFFDAGAPQSVKDAARAQMSRENSATGMFGPDDGENFQRITESTGGFVSRTQDFNYTMGIGHEGEVREPGYPGHLGPHYSEQNHRNFYRYWLELMTAPGGDHVHY